MKSNTMIPARRHAAPFLLVCLTGAILCAETVRAGGLPATDYIHGVAAEVGSGKIGADQIFELWGPVWYETLTKVRNGKMSAEEGDAKLQAEWTHSLQAMIKDELFYHEAEQDNNSQINHIVEQIYRIQQQSNSYPKTRAEIAAEIRSQVRQDMDRRFRELTSELVKDSGGMIKLKKVLEGRGMSYRDWQERLRRKAFTYSYLNMTIKPRAPAPGPKAIQEYYAKHDDEFKQPGVVKFKHIFFSKEARGGDDAAREAASEVWGMLISNEVDFETAAAKYSDDKPSAERGGLETEGTAADPEREAWLADIRVALREETPGKLAPILDSPFGYHLAELISIAPDTKIPFKEVRKDIERKLENQVFQAEVDKYYAVVRKNTNIKIMMPNFPQQLSCAAQQVRPQDVPAIYKLGEVGIPGLY